MVRGIAHLLPRNTEGAGLRLLEKGGPWEDLIVAFQYLKEAYKQEGKQLFHSLIVIGQGTMVLSGKRFKYLEVTFYLESGETLEQVVKRSCGHPAFIEYKIHYSKIAHIHVFATPQNLIIFIGH